METKLGLTAISIEGRVAKSSLKWIAAIFAIPTLAALFSAWAFISSADYRYGSYLQAKTNEAKIQLLEERTVLQRGDLQRAQVDIMNELTDIKRDIKFLTGKIGEVTKR